MSVYIFFYLLFIYVSLIVPGYAFVKKSGFLKDSAGLQLCLSCALTLITFALCATADYTFHLDIVSRCFCWLFIVVGIFLFIKERYYKSLWALRFPLFCLLAINAFSLAFINLNFNAPLKIIPDPQPLPDRNYSVLDVKILNVANTNANDNYIPYRQAQFFVNHSDPAHDSFINEWGVSFFQRTPLMGAVTAGYFGLLNDKPPTAYVWSSLSQDPSHTFLKFQLIAQVLNGLFILPGIFVLRQLFNRKTALVTSFFLIISQFFVYNAFFSWPKSLAAFFILTSLLLLLKKGSANTIIAGMIGGVAYLTHDLAVLYIGTFVIYLAVVRRFRDILLYLLPGITLAAPWLLTASFKYHNSSSFIYYPFSVHGIPQTNKGNVIFQQFLHTPIHTILAARIRSLFFLLSPYQLFFSQGGQELGRRLWSLGLYSVPGALGLGLIVPAYVSIFRYFKKLWPVTVFILAPVVSFVLVTGWDLSTVNIEGALHFAEPIIVIWSGLAIFWLLKIGKPWLVLLVYLINAMQFVFFVFYSYKYRTSVWFNSPGEILLLSVLVLIMCFGGWMIYRIAEGREILRSLDTGHTL